MLFINKMKSDQCSKYKETKRKHKKYQNKYTEKRKTKLEKKTNPDQTWGGLNPS